jgi:lactate 2-monooxygenase
MSSVPDQSTDGFGRARQSEIYIGGASGAREPVPSDAQALEAAARLAMSPEGYDYIAGGAGLQSTLAANRAAFERWRILPRMLRDVSVVDTSVELLGARLPTPFLLAPIGVLEMAHPDADVAVARAAAAEGIPMIFSTQASCPMEACAAELGATPRWFQLYWGASQELVASFVSRAEACGCSAIVLTLDTKTLGWRVRDLDNAFLPFLSEKGIAQYTNDPVFQRLVEEAGGTAVEQFLRLQRRPSLGWDDLAWLRSATTLPVLLKGILHPDDARLAVEAGIDGIIVSNHGGRQVDGAIGSLDALPAVVEAVGGSVPVLLDSGIRGGADVFKAIALGATAVLLGRPYAYGLAIAQQAGVQAVIRNVRAEFELTMGLTGCSDLAAVSREMLVPIP